MYIKQINNKNGITLIALVITIIVLIILAGVTIVTLTGDNGLLQKAGEAKQANEVASAQEKIQVEVAGSYDLDEKIDIEQLNNNLKRINGLKYDDKDIVLEGDNKNIIEQLPAEVFLDGNNFFIDENGKVLDWKNADLINKKIGNIVEGYNAQNLEWQVYYSDPVETYLISKENAKTKFSIPLTRKKYNENEEEYAYKGSEDVRKSPYGAKWNKKWLDKCLNDESTLNNAKAAAYMCDPYNWTEYREGVANYAVGAATEELLIASWNKSQDTNIEIQDEEVSKKGYLDSRPTEFMNEGTLNTNINSGIYGGVMYKKVWIASPCDGWNWGNNCLRYINSNGILDFYYYYAYEIARPIVSIPTSKISVNEDTVTVNP